MPFLNHDGPEQDARGDARRRPLRRVQRPRMLPQPRHRQRSTLLTHHHTLTMTTHYVWLTRTHDSARILVNLAKVDSVEPAENGEGAYLLGAQLFRHVRESVEAIAACIAVTTVE